MEKCISAVKTNICKEMQIWAKVGKDAEAQVEYAKKEIKTNDL